ncbi:MAG: hypothetical protein ACXWWD_00540 [Chitinophagaceae bacterium]
MKEKAAWITWENQRRNRELSKSLGIPLFELSEIDSISNPLRKYVTGIIKTLKILLEERPELVICQNPSLILALFLVICKRFINIRLFVDSHNAGIYPKEGKSFLLNRLARFIQRHADLTIVTNHVLKEHVERNGGKSFVFPDKIPDLPQIKVHPLKGKYNFLFICTFAIDEPYNEVFEAARRVGPEICIYVSGNFKKKGITTWNLPENLTLLGFIPEEEYIGMIRSVDATIVLSERENCLLCGAYETVASEKPMILSNKEALRNYFDKGAIYSENISEDIAKSMYILLGKMEFLSEQIKQLKEYRLAEWEIMKNELKDLILNT